MLITLIYLELDSSESGSFFATLANINKDLAIDKKYDIILI